MSEVKTPHPADSERETPKSIEVPPELRAAPSERAAAILLELAQLRAAMQDLRDEIRQAVDAKHEAVDARFKLQQADIDSARNEIKRLERRIHDLQEELGELREEGRKAKQARDEERAERDNTLTAIKTYVDQLSRAHEEDRKTILAERDAYREAHAEILVVAKSVEEYRAESKLRSDAFVKFAATQSVIVEDLGYELDDNGVPKLPDKNKPTKLTRAAETNTGVRAAIVLLMVQIIWAIVKVVASGQIAEPPARQPTSFEHAR